LRFSKMHMRLNMAYATTPSMEIVANTKIGVIVSTTQQEKP